MDSNQYIFLALNSTVAKAELALYNTFLNKAFPNYLYLFLF